MMMSPPSLPLEVRERAFTATNGELGLLLSDASAFLSACRADNVEVLGWELWLVDPFSRQWTGLLPMVGSATPGVFSFDSDASTSEKQLAELDLNQIEASVLPCIRVNFTLDA
jgi:hypothetical protein